MADYIRREAAIKAVKSQTCWHYNNSMIDEQGIIFNIDKIPAADVRPVVMGRWLPHPGGYREWDICSVCKTGCKRRSYVTVNGKEGVEEFSYSFCPWCGANMRSDLNT